MQQIVTTETHNGVKGLEYRTTLRTATGKGLSGLSTYGSTPEESRKEMAKHITEREIRWMDGTPIEIGPDGMISQ